MQRKDPRRLPRNVWVMSATSLLLEPRRGTAFGLFNAAIGIATLPASVIAGVLWQGMGA